MFNQALINWGAFFLFLISKMEISYLIYRSRKMFLFFLLFLLLCDFSQNLSEWSPFSNSIQQLTLQTRFWGKKKISPAMTQAYTQIMAEMNAFLTV